MPLNKKGKKILYRKTYKMLGPNYSNILDWKWQNKEYNND